MTVNQFRNYELIRSLIRTDGQIYETYGIKGKTVCFKDVSTDKSVVVDMIERLNKEKLEESQFYYFISDEIDR